MANSDLAYVYGFSYALTAARFGSEATKVLLHEHAARRLSRALAGHGQSISEDDLKRFSRGPLWGAVQTYLVLQNYITVTSTGLVTGHRNLRRKLSNLFVDELEHYVGLLKTPIIETEDPDRDYENWFDHDEYDGLLSKGPPLTIYDLLCPICDYQWDECGHSTGNHILVFGTGIETWNNLR